MLLKYFSKRKKSDTSLSKLDINIWIKDVLSKAKLESLLNSKIDYTKYFLKIAMSVFKRRNINQSALYDLYSDAVLKTLSIDTLSKYTKANKDYGKDGLEKYLGKFLENTLNSSITTLKHKYEKESPLDDNSDYQIPYQTDFINEIEYKGLLDDIKYYFKYEIKVRPLFSDYLDLIIDGYSLREISEKLKYSNVYIMKAFHDLISYLTQYAKFSNNDSLSKMLNKIQSKKSSTDDDFIKDLHDGFKSLLYSATKKAALIKITTSKDILNEDFLMNATLDPKLSSDRIKIIVSEYLNSIDDNTDVIQEDSNTIAIKTVEL